MKSKKEMLDALLAGETLINKKTGAICRMEMEHEKGPFVFYEGKGKTGERMGEVWNGFERLEIKPRPKKRIMTRWKIIQEVSDWQRSGLRRLVRYDRNEWGSPFRYPYSEGQTEHYEWTETDPATGEPVGEPQKFEVEVDE